MHRLPRPGITGLVLVAAVAASLSPGSAVGTTPAAFPSTLSGIHLSFGMQGRLSTTQSEAVAAADAGDMVAALPIQIKQFGAAMKTVNPSVKLFAYQNGMFAQAKNGSAFPDSWYLKTASGQKVQATGTGNYLMNPLSTAVSNGAAGWTDYVAQQCRTAMADPNTSGCFLDQMNAAPLGSGFVNGAPVDPRTGTAFTRTAYMTLVAQQGQAVASQLNGPVVGNAYDSAPRYYAIPTSLVNASAGMGTFEAEHWFGNDVTQSQSLPAWQQGVQMEIDAQAAGHGVIVNVDAPGTNVEQWRRYLTASYLLGNNGAAWLEFGPDAQTAPFDSPSPLYATPIGTPLQTGGRVSDYAKNGVYQRAYSNGLVLVNPSSSSVTVDLGGTYTNESGSAVTSVTLSAWSGAILTGSGAASSSGGGTSGSGGTGSAGSGSGGTGSGGTGSSGDAGLSAVWASGAPWKYPIGWTQASGASISVTIRNAAGAVVRHKVVDRTYAAGAHQVTWSGYDDAHIRVPVGTYSVTISAVDSTGQSSATVPISIS
jgi:uncharacterized membrane protein YgcG